MKHALMILGLTLATPLMTYAAEPNITYAEEVKQDNGQPVVKSAAIIAGGYQGALLLKSICDSRYPAIKSTSDRSMEAWLVRNKPVQALTDRVFSSFAARNTKTNDQYSAVMKIFDSMIQISVNSTRVKLENDKDLPKMCLGLPFALDNGSIELKTRFSEEIKVLDNAGFR